jgi:hypothetical protein
VALSQLQLNVLRTVAIDDLVPVSVLVGYQQEETGARRTVARASLTRSLRRLWRIGAVELRGRRGSLTLGHSTASLMSRETRTAAIKAVTITRVGRDLLDDAEGGRFSLWRDTISQPMRCLKCCT